jgi:hypothetical protein
VHHAAMRTMRLGGEPDARRTATPSSASSLRANRVWAAACRPQEATVHVLRRSLVVCGGLERGRDEAANRVCRLGGAYSYRVRGRADGAVVRSSRDPARRCGAAVGPIAPEDVPRISHVVLLDLDNCMHLFSAYAPTCRHCSQNPNLPLSDPSRALCGPISMHGCGCVRSRHLPSESALKLGREFGRCAGCAVAFPKML